MTESQKQAEKWKKHEIEENVGRDPCQNSQLWTGNFYFVIGADTQLGCVWPRVERDATDWKQEMDLAICAVDKINNLTPKPQFVVICGDFVNETPHNDSKIFELQVNDFKKIFSKLHSSISLVCVCGNHDIGNIPNVKSINKYRNNFGQDYFSYWCGGVLFLVLNSQYYINCSEVEELAAQQDQWLTEKLNKHQGQRIIVFQHIPWFIDDIEEEKGYFNIEKIIRKEMLERLNSAGVSHVFCGHYHRNCTGYYKNLEIITTNAIGAPAGDDPPGLRIVKVYENNVIHTYYPFKQMPNTIIN